MREQNANLICKGYSNNEGMYVCTSLRGMGSDAQHSLGCIEEVSGMIKSVEAHHISTCHGLIHKERERESDRDRERRRVRDGERER